MSNNIDKMLAQPVLLGGPFFVHDCDACRFLGHHRTPNAPVIDLYVCDGEYSQAWIWRWGNEGYQYGCFERKIALEFAAKEPNGVYAAIEQLLRDAIVPPDKEIVQ